MFACKISHTGRTSEPRTAQKKNSQLTVINKIQSFRLNEQCDKKQFSDNGSSEMSKVRENRRASRSRLQRMALLKSVERSAMLTEQALPKAGERPPAAAGPDNIRR